MYIDIRPPLSLIPRACPLSLLAANFLVVPPHLRVRTRQWSRKRVTSRIASVLPALDLVAQSRNFLSSPPPSREPPRPGTA